MPNLQAAKPSPRFWVLMFLQLKKDESHQEEIAQYTLHLVHELLIYRLIQLIHMVRQLGNYQGTTPPFIS